MAKDLKKDVFNYDISAFINILVNNLKDLKSKETINSKAKVRRLEQKIRDYDRQQKGGKWGKVVLQKDFLDNYQPRIRKKFYELIIELLEKQVFYFIDGKDFCIIRLVEGEKNMYLERTNFDVIYVEDFVYIFKDKDKNGKPIKQIAPRILVVASDVCRETKLFNGNGFTIDFFERMNSNRVSNETFYNKIDEIEFGRDLKELPKYVANIKGIKEHCDIIVDFNTFGNFYNNDYKEGNQYAHNAD